MNKKIIIGTVLMILLVGMLSGCVSDNNNKDTTIPEPIYQDDEFLGWLFDTNENLMWYTNKKIDVLETESWFLSEYYEEAEENLIENTYIPQCRAFVLSYSYDVIRDEFYEYLEDRSWAAFYGKWAAIDLQSGDVSGAIDNWDDSNDFLRKAIVHLDTCTNLISNLI